MKLSPGAVVASGQRLSGSDDSVASRREDPYNGALTTLPRWMKRVSRPLLVLHPDRGLRDRVEEACADEFQFVNLPDWEALEEAIRTAPPAAMVLVDPYLPLGNGSAGREVTPRLRELLHAYPSTPILAAMPVRAEMHEDLRQLGGWGIVQVIATVSS